ncbi:MAG: DUF6249 domain-containing protein [Candidatus Caldatribacteriaceae bacterium]
MEWIFVLVPIVGMLVGIVAILAEHREKMAMIERGLNPKDLKPPTSPQDLLKGGLVLARIGAGFLLAQAVGQITPWLPLPAFLFIGIGGGWWLRSF